MYLNNLSCSRRLQTSVLCVCEGSRVLPLNRDLITEAVCKDHLDSIWTPKKALEYLLLSGLMPDAVWFVGQLGDWKAQLIMAVTVQFHCESSAKERLSRWHYVHTLCLLVIISLTSNSLLFCCVRISRH